MSFSAGCMPGHLLVRPHVDMRSRHSGPRPATGPGPRAPSCPAEARTEAAEARIAGPEAELPEARADAERRKRESAEARSKPNSLRATFGQGREKLAASRAGQTALRRSRASGNVRRPEKKVVHPEALLDKAGIDGGRGQVTVLRRKISRLKGRLAGREEEIREPGAERETRRSAPATRAGARFGRKSGKRKRAGTAVGRRGRQKGSPGHGRTRRPALEQKTGSHDPAAARMCSCCGLPHVRNGSHVAGIMEIEVKAHVRLIRRGVAAGLCLHLLAEGGGCAGATTPCRYRLRHQRLRPLSS